MKVIFVKLWIIFLMTCTQNVSGFEEKLPTVLIITLIRNKAHTLPYFFTYLENLDYPKDRISLWIRSDHNEDNTLEIIDVWLNSTKDLYHSVDYKHETKPQKRKSESSYLDWTNERFGDIISMKEAALAKAKNMWADFVFFLDADVFLTNPKTLTHLIMSGLPIVAPMLTSDGMYSNFWGAMKENFYYARSDDYKSILQYEKTGDHIVPMVHSAVLFDVNIKNIEEMTFDPKKLKKLLAAKGQTYNGPYDDIITFALSANFTGVPMYVNNAHSYGHVLSPLDSDQNFALDKQQMTNILLMIVNNQGKVEVVESMKQFVTMPKKDSLVFSKIFMINLLRRTERRIKMQNNFDLLGLQVEHFPAVDGKIMSDEWLIEQGIGFLPGFLDPYHNRPMTFGEIGCFLSHFRIWEKMMKENLELVLILEDDVRFEHNFRKNAAKVINQAKESGKDWDLIYFGRKRLKDAEEKWIGNGADLVEAGYSYWTLGYVLTLKGAQKLLAQKPLKKLVPVDEYLPIMFGKHPNDDYNVQFEPRNLIAWSALPLLMYPTHYTGEEGYISDTERSETINIQVDTTAKADETAEKKGKKSHYENELNDHFPEGPDVKDTMSSRNGQFVGKSEL